jgi:arginyl-tRNA--protein-N-Asp/Glu arginylyltransferase
MSPESLNQSFLCDSVPPEMMDRLWEAGWRHFGETFFRYSLSIDEYGVKTITPLRVNLDKFSLSKNQRRVLKKNADLHCTFVPASLSPEAHAMFQRHKERFSDNVPDNLDTFLSASPANLPCPAEECRVYLGEELIALSYLDLGAVGTSAVYGMFEPVHSERRLGILTMLKEIEYTQSRGSHYYYPGYATLEPSAYDYKKQLRGLEVLDWQTGLWDDYARKINPDTP